MDAEMYCLVDDRGHVYVKDGAESYAEIARGCGIGRTRMPGLPIRPG